MTQRFISDARLDALRDALVNWYSANARTLPWRSDPAPWRVWVSEVMLQQTRVDTVVPYFERFIERFDSPRSLAESTETEVLSAWAGLGYYQRARSLYAGARAIVEDHDGEIPSRFDALRALPGVGDYTAGAIASIAFGQREPIVDGNVERVLSRLVALNGDPKRAPQKQSLRTLARRIADHRAPGTVNQAMMELGAMVCSPRTPRCEVCPVKTWCGAWALGTPEKFPQSPPRLAPTPENWTALVPHRGQALWLARSLTQRWTGLLVPAMTSGTEPPDAITLRSLFGLEVRNVTPIGTVEHTLTHAKLFVSISTAELLDFPTSPMRGVLDTPTKLLALGLPKITTKVLAKITGVDANPSSPKAKRRRPPSPH